MNMVNIYTDGSCLGNPGPGGWGVIIIFNGVRSQNSLTAKARQPACGGSLGKEIKLSGGEADSTNNRMEMTAIMNALKWLNTQKNIESEDVTIYSDSNLLIQTLNKGWKKKANKDLWAEIDKLRGWLNIKWEWVKAHHTNKYNNAVDRIALKEAEKQKNK
ncbi:ribonuclease HI, partial [Candidatus Peregrinibacteria bacterium]|nr:ribonuclease HI [Candidatus Peregrinibacteria bacterium]